MIRFLIIFLFVNMIHVTGVIACQSDSTDNIVNCIKKAENGDVTAQYNLGVIFYSGIGVADKDYQESAKWFQRAANNRHKSAQYMIGNMTLLGDGVKKDPKKALNWLTLAALQGYPDAEHSLALIYFSGDFRDDGIEKDYEKAYLWSYQNFRRRDTRIEQKLYDEIYDKLSRKKRAEIEEQARDIIEARY